MSDLLNDQYSESAPKRPVFLKVLCILTFVISGWNLLGSVEQYFDANQVAADMAAAMKQQITVMPTQSAEGEKINQMLLNSISKFTPETIRRVAIGTFLTSALCLWGALLMWRLRRNGFYLYVAGTVIGVSIPFIFFGYNLVALGSSIVLGLFGLLFIILYGLNLKHMR